MYCLERCGKEVKVSACEDKILLEDRVLQKLLETENRYNVVFTQVSSNIQTEVTMQMREIVAEWMMEVADEQKRQDEVFTLAMNYFNRFLLLRFIKKNQLQLLGATCLFIASKLRESEPFTTDTLILYTDYSITKNLLMRWEVLVLSQLKWDIAAITPFDFLPHLLRRLPLEQYDIKEATAKNHAKILITLCAKEYKFVGRPASLIANACLASALSGLGYPLKDALVDQLATICDINKELLKETVRDVDEMIASSTKLLDMEHSTTVEGVRPEEQTPEKYRDYNTAITPTDVHDVSNYYVDTGYNKNTVG